MFSNKTIKSNNRWALIVLGILIMMFLGTVYSYSVFRVALENELQVGSAKSGMPYMVALAFYALFMFFTSKHIESSHPRNVIITGGLLVALGWILSSFATDIFVLTITYGCISGAGVGIAYGVLMNAAAKWFPDKKGFAVGLILVGFGLSPLITAPVARILVVNFGVMRAFFILGVSFGVLLPVLAFPFKYPSCEDVSSYNYKTQHSHDSEDIPLKEMIKTMSFKGVYLNFTIGTMIGLMMIGMTNNVGVDYFELESLMVTRLMAIFAIFNGIGRPIFGWITDRFALRNTMILSFLLISVAAMGLITLGNDIVVYIITFSIFWFNMGGWLAIAPTSTLKLYGIKNYSDNYGLVFTAYGIGAIAGVTSSGILLDFHGNYLNVFYYVIALCLVGVILTNKYIKT
ncbi:OFA family MFS transporter [Natranaerobius trueperi]|uniref:MFS transporter n=1 Tax=Natranaerobius trueperi TaxID=759412 RepID=A0A226C0P8_9FIRM|nr:OFA family MFS transporter [Natranaerobius trueperi]OWZ84806.1 MFS transporter [Natranaerobius trueperi]